MKCKTYPFGTLGNYIYADVVAFYNEKWLLSKHKMRMTWETQGGHIEADETPLETAKRELYEESGVTDFDIEPLCDYRVSGYFNGKKIDGNSQVFFAKVHTLGEIPQHSEMEKVCLFDTLPDNLTYLEVANEVLPIIQERLKHT